MTLFGYGKILEVNLSSGDITHRETDPQFARNYVGGMGFSCKILYDEVGPETDPLSADNVLIFANGPLTGTGAPCSGRTEVTTKSALTGSIGTGNTGGMWGTLLKRAGYDVIIIRGMAERPVYLWIDDEVAEIREAGHLWGNDTEKTTNLLLNELGASGTSGCSVLAIGPAGENLVRFACPMNDIHHTAARAGAGSAMGAKRLKAIAVRGTGALQMARPEAFLRAAKETRERLMKSFGIGDASRNAIANYQKRGYFPHKNFQTGILPEWVQRIGRDTAKKYCTRKEATCHACPISCFHLAEVNEGKYAGTRVTRAQHPGVVIEWGAKCAVDNLPAIWRCKQLCQQFGMDYISVAGVIAFAMELFQREIITVEETDGLDLSWGNEDAVVEMIRKIAFREGFGDLLAEGSVRAAARIGKGAERYVMTIKGMEKMSGDPRAEGRGAAFGELTNPRGGDNLKGTHFRADDYNPDWWVDEFDMFEEIKEKIYCMAPEDTHSTWEGKALMCRWFEDLYSVLNCLGLCIFPSGMNLAVGPTHLSKLYSACTGWDVTPEEIMKVGEKAFTLLKAYTVRQALTRQEDSWPNRFFDEPLPEGPSKGAILSRDVINKLLDEYYELRDWNKRFGIPTKKKLVELGLEDIARDLARHGKL